MAKAKCYTIEPSSLTKLSLTGPWMFISSRYKPEIPLLKREFSTPPSQSTLTGTFASWEKARERLAKLQKLYDEAKIELENKLDPPKFLTLRLADTYVKIPELRHLF